MSESFRQAHVFGAVDAAIFPQQHSCAPALCLGRRRQGALSSAHRQTPGGVGATLLVPVCAATSHAFAIPSVAAVALLPRS